VDPFEAVKVTFFQECEEQLAELEAGLLALESGEGDGETINAIFRAVHSVKGGAGAFGFDDLVRFSHIFETTMDLLRSGKLEPGQDVLKVLLRAADVLADHVQAAKGGGAVDEARSAAIANELEVLNDPNAAKPAAAIPATAPAVEEEDSFGFTPLKFVISDLDAPTGAPIWNIFFKPHARMYGSANDAMLLLREVSRLGDAKVSVNYDSLPHIEDMDPLEGYVSWTIELRTDKTEEDIREVFDFVEGECDLRIAQGKAAASPAAPVAAASAPDFDISALLASVRTPDVGALDKSAPVEAPVPKVVDLPVAAPSIPTPVQQAVEDRAKADAKAAAAQAASAATIRVELDRVDRLIDLVGELVINQAMLAQRVMEAGVARSSSVAMGLDELEQLTREIQDSVMAIRAQPVKSVFQRMPRLVREIAAATGKEVRLVTDGENTEVDKTVIERLTDPITHMLRNAIDHGLESPEERIAAGKPLEGVVKLSAAHRSGRVIIEVSDDGKGINRDRVREKAIEKGLIVADAQLSEEDIDNLIFLPGFSTASALSELSGRGVGMDVVKKSIQALGGRISINSAPGKGSIFTLSLPLTLAVLDGMVVKAGDQTLVVPLSNIVETLQPKAHEVRRLGPRGSVLFVRGTYVPMINVTEQLGWTAGASDPTKGVVILVEGEAGSRSALLVDEIQGQRQVVIKSLEQNYQRVEGIAAATILGDGRVALILDTDAVIAGLYEGAEGAQQLLEAS
jgi:two-component system chemotaxis sensor kinase CheA